MIPFLTVMELSEQSSDISNMEEEKLVYNGICLQPIIAPVNHNTLTASKAVQIVHTLIGNFCHGDVDKTSQIENMVNDASLLMGWHDKVGLEWCTSNLS
jgi:hypothetical protein